MSTDGSTPRWVSQPAAQREGLEVAPLVTFLLGTLLLIGGGVYGATFWFQREADAAAARAAASAQYPELQQSDIHALGKLGHYRLLREEEGIFQIPIERAITVLVQESRPDVALTSELRY